MRIALHDDIHILIADRDCACPYSSCEIGNLAIDLERRNAHDGSTFAVDGEDDLTRIILACIIHILGAWEGFEIALEITDNGFEIRELVRLIGQELDTDSRPCRRTILLCLYRDFEADGAKRIQFLQKYFLQLFTETQIIILAFRCRQELDEDTESIILEFEGREFDLRETSETVLDWDTIDRCCAYER
jgi:hypothetical protein